MERAQKTQSDFWIRRIMPPAVERAQKTQSGFWIRRMRRGAPKASASETGAKQQIKRPPPGGGAALTTDREPWVSSRGSEAVAAEILDVGAGQADVVELGGA